MIAEFGRLGQSSLDCLDAARLLGEVEALAACAPRIQVPAACSVADTLNAIPQLMKGGFRVWRFRLLRRYLDSTQASVRQTLALRAEELAVSGRWNSYVALKILLARFYLQLALLNGLGILFVFHFPVRFEPVCARLIRLVGD